MSDSGQDYHWRDTMRPARFFIFDARAAAPLMFFIMHARLWTFLLFVFSLIGFNILERYGLTVAAALRSFRRWVVGDRRPAFLYTRRRKMIDNG